MTNLTHHQRKALLALTAEPQEASQLHMEHGIGHDSLNGLYFKKLAVHRKQPFKPMTWKLTKAGIALKQELEQNQ